MHVLITNVTLATRTGTEIVTRDLACGLAHRGHRVTVYTPRRGGIADEITASGVSVIDDLRTLAVGSPAPDVVHGHHHQQTVQALLRFPTARGIFVCHDRLAWTDIPPPFPRILQWVAVDENCRERLAAWEIPSSRTRVIGNAVDLSRFPARAPLPATPRRAVIFGNSARDGVHVEPILTACAERGLEVTQLGGVTEPASTRPEECLSTTDLVFAKARCALEALAAGCSVVLVDTRGLGPLVTGDDVARLYAWNFGIRLLDRAPTAQRIIAEIDRYDSTEAAAVTAWVRSHASLEGALDAYEALYRDVLDDELPAASGDDELDVYLRSLLERVPPDRSADAGWWMHRLPEGATRGLSLAVTTAPARLEVGEGTSVSVEIVNHTGWRLSSLLPHPVHLSYRWIDSARSITLPTEGVRTAFVSALESGEVRALLVKVRAPDSAGSYVLRVTLVQEEVAWFDDLDPPVSAEVPVCVG